MGEAAFPPHGGGVATLPQTPLIPLDASLRDIRATNPYVDAKARVGGDGALRLAPATFPL